MKVVTKRSELEKKKYYKLGLKILLKSEWKWGLIPLAVIIAGFALGRGFGWMYVLGFATILGYIGFRWLQMFALTQHEMGKSFFYKMNFEMDGRHFMMKMDAKNGMPIDWKSFQTVHKMKDGYVIVIARSQFIYLPFNIFKTENDRKLTETIFSRKNLI